MVWCACMRAWVVWRLRACYETEVWFSGDCTLIGMIHGWLTGGWDVGWWVVKRAVKVVVPRCAERHVTISPGRPQTGPTLWHIPPHLPSHRAQVNNHRHLQSVQVTCLPTALARPLALYQTLWANAEFCSLSSSHLPNNNESQHFPRRKRGHIVYPSLVLTYL